MKTHGDFMEWFLPLASDTWKENFEEELDLATEGLWSAVHEHCFRFGPVPLDPKAAAKSLSEVSVCCGVDEWLVFSSELLERGLIQKTPYGFVGFFDTNGGQS